MEKWIFYFSTILAFRFYQIPPLHHISITSLAFLLVYVLLVFLDKFSMQLFLPTFFEDIQSTSVLFFFTFHKYSTLISCRKSWFLLVLHTPSSLNSPKYFRCSLSSPRRLSLLVVNNHRWCPLMDNVEMLNFISKLPRFTKTKQKTHGSDSTVKKTGHWLSINDPFWR